MRLAPGEEGGDVPLAAIVASYAPARRVLRVAPIVAMGAEQARPQSRLRWSP